jgi:hypothetical protein
MQARGKAGCSATLMAMVRSTSGQAVGIGLVICALVLGAMMMDGQCVRCTYIQGAGFAGDVTKCTDAGDCGPNCASCCLRYTCVGHPPACYQNCGQACTFTYTCSDIDSSTACDSDCGASASVRPRLASKPTNLAFAIFPVLLQLPLQPPRSTTPFTLVREVWSFQHNPKGELHRSQTIAVRTDGSRSVTETILGRELKRTLNFADGRRVTQFLGSGLKNNWPSLNEAAIAEKSARLHALEAAQCLIPGWTKVGADTIQQQAVTTFLHTSEDLAWKLTVMSALQLGCEDLRQLFYDRQADGSFALTTDTRTVSLHVGEPDASFFDEPAELREASPFEVGQLLARKYGIPMSPEQIHENMRLFENAYSGSARRRP